MIQVSNLSFTYTKHPFISDMGFSVSSGEIFAFLGPSGASKSTYRVHIHFSTTSTETMSDKIKCILKNEIKGLSD